MYLFQLQIQYKIAWSARRLRDETVLLLGLILAEFYMSFARMISKDCSYLFVIDQWR